MWLKAEFFCHGSEHRTFLSNKGTDSESSAGAAGVKSAKTSSIWLYLGFVTGTNIPRIIGRLIQMFLRLDFLLNS